MPLLFENHSSILAVRSGARIQHTMFGHDSSEILAMITFGYHESILQVIPVMLILEAIYPELPRLTREKLLYSRDLSDAGQVSHERNAPLVFGYSFARKVAWLNLSYSSQLLPEKNRYGCFSMDGMALPRPKAFPQTSRRSRRTDNPEAVIHLAMLANYTTSGIDGHIF